MTHTNQRLKSERIRFALSHEDLAERVGTTSSNVSRWERGITSPTPYFRRKLCDVFQLTPDELFPGETASSALFFFNMDLEDASECYGRKREKLTLLSRASRGEAISLVGPRRIGKTWLMKYLKLVAPAELGAHYHIGYLDATSPSCATLSGFTTEALNALEIPLPGQREGDTIPLAALERGVIALQARGETPLLCIDEIESLCKREAYHGIVLEHLRAISQAGLGLVVASKQPLIEIVATSEQTSPFFNICRQVTLKPFTRQEAEDFAQKKSAQASFSEEECGYLLANAREKERDVWFPLRLQLVGTLLHEDKLLAELEHPDYYRPQAKDYWQEFEERVTEIYQGAVRQ